MSVTKKYIWKPIQITWIARRKNILIICNNETWKKCGVWREFCTRHGQNVKYFIWKFIQKDEKTIEIQSVLSVDNNSLVEVTEVQGSQSWGWDIEQFKANHRFLWEIFQFQPEKLIGF